MGSPAFSQQTFSTCPPHRAGVSLGLMPEFRPKVLPSPCDDGLGTPNTRLAASWFNDTLAATAVGVHFRLGLRIRVRDPGPKYVGPVSPFFDLLRPDRCRYDLGPRYVALGSFHGWSFTYWSVVFGGAPFARSSRTRERAMRGASVYQLRSAGQVQDCGDRRCMPELPCLGALSFHQAR